MFERDDKRRVVTGVEDFIQKNCGKAKLRKEDCWVRKPGDIEKTLAIPVALRELFLNWFDLHVNNLFFSYEGIVKKT